MNRYNISVIIPVYNTKKYLQECLDSVLNQTIVSTEIIFVDDGSDDGSWELIQDFQKIHDNVKSARQWRERQGAARNKGMRLATGDYIAFLDSDDTVPLHAYQNMYILAKNSAADMVVGIQESFSKVRRWVGVPVHQKKFGALIEATSVTKFPELLTDISVCNKLFKRTSLTDNNITFPEKTAGEDLEFVAQTLLKFDKISVIPEVVYNYRARENTSTGRLNPNFFKERVCITIKMGELYKFFGKEDLFQYLLTSELRKLVGNRLNKVILHSGDEDQNLVLNCIQQLAVLSNVSHLTGSDMVEDIDKLKILLIKEKQYETLDSLVKNGLGKKVILSQNSSNCSGLINNLWGNCRNAGNLSHVLKAQGINAGFRLAYKNGKKKARPYYYKLRNFFKTLLTFNFTKFLCILKYVLVRVGIRPHIKAANIESNVWLIDERWGQSAEDNSFCLFAYLRTTLPDLPVFYVIDRNSSDRKRILDYGNVIDLFSLKHMHLLHKAKVLISTDGFKALAYPYEVFPILRRNTLNVFLQHGISGNKTMSYYKVRYPYFNLVITSNEREKKSFLDVYGFNEDEVTVTGLSRFDNLPLEPQNGQIQKILVAPTWRKWLKRKSNITDSSYYKSWNSLITSEKLLAILERHGIQLIFQPHFNMMKYIDKFEKNSEWVKIIYDSSELLQNYIIDCDLLITDYSSVMYDFFFQQKPVFSLMFDLDEWNTPPNGPSLIDFDEELPLNRYNNVGSLLEDLEKLADNYFPYSSDKIEKITSLFTIRDHNNSKRIYDIVHSKVVNH